MPPRFIASQFARPRGFLGRLFAHLMNRRNAKMNAFAVSQLQLRRSDRVLEIGFGGGLNLPSLIEEAGFLCGVDPSPDVVNWAKAKFAQQIKDGRVDFREGYANSLPFSAASFDKLCTVNTVYFWNSLDAGCAEIHRVLAPGGRAVIGFLPKERMQAMGLPPDIFTLRTIDDVIAALTKAGFNDARAERPEPDTPWCAAVANSVRLP